MFISGKRLSWMTVFLPVLASASSASAAIINLDIVLEIDASSVVEIPVGDKFKISLSFDDSALDTNPATWGGAFPDAMQSYSIAGNPENSGTWDPACGTPDLDQDNFVTNANGDGMTIQMRGTDFPPASPGEFLDVDLSFGFSVDLVDTGSGQTLRQILGDALFFDDIIFASGEIRFGDSYISATGFIDIGDDDGDGVLNMFDVCDSTPPGAAIVTDPDDPLYGTLRHDSDGDCDCDLMDYAAFQNELTGPNP